MFVLSPGDYARRSPIFPTGYVALASASQTHLLPVDDGPSRVASHVRHRMPSCPAVAGASARLSAPHPPLDSTRDDLWYDGWAGLRLRCPGQTCVLADTLLGAEAERYDHGILCKRTLRPLRIYTKGNPCAAATPPHPSRPRLPLLRCEALTHSAADNMRSSGSAPLPAARCSVACCTLQRCVLHVAALQRCTVAPHRLGAGLTQATAKRLAIEISQRGRVVSSFLLPWHQIGWIDAQTKRQARAASV
jgi:hypothetical protein